MALEDDINALSSVALFEAFTHDQLRLMAFGAERLSLKKDRQLYHQGEPADCAYVVTLGRIALVGRDAAGNQAIIRTVRPGAILGEFALISPTKRLTGAVAETDAEVIRLNRSLFHRILEEYPDLAIALHEHIAEQFAEMVGRIERLNRHFET
jgi:CRP-like cAMP-binding protein